MFKKRMDVVELNKKEDKIVLEEVKSPLLHFWHKHNKMLFLTMLILSLTILTIGVSSVVRNLSKSGDWGIKQATLDTSLDKYSANIVTGNNSLSQETAKSSFNKSSEFKTTGETILIRTVENDDFIIKYYTDGTVIKIAKALGVITRIGPLANGGYGVNEAGAIYSNATNNMITIIETKEYSWGKVTYYSDGSAMIEKSDMDIFVRDSKDINSTYIADERLSYLKESKKVGNDTLNYYYDGTIEVIKNNKSYVLRDEKDLDLSNNTVSFKNNNAASVVNTKQLADGVVIDYYSDGGAIIRRNGGTISVRKSNSIVIKDNKLYEMVGSEYVTVSSTKNGTVYYTNGGATFTYNGTMYYVPENSDVKYNNNNQVANLPSDSEKLASESNTNGTNIKMFEKTAIVTTNDYTAIVPKDKIVYDANGNIKSLDPIDDGLNTFTIVNNTNDNLNYRIVIERSSRTNLDEEYIWYQLSTNNDYVAPAVLNNSVWGKDAVAKSFGIKGTNFILFEGIIDAHTSEDVSIMLWTDYDTIPNSMQNKYFYGTIKVYAWSDK